MNEVRDFARNQDDRKDALSILKLNNWQEAYRFLSTRNKNGHYMHTLGKSLGFDINNKKFGHLAKEIYDYAQGVAEIPVPEKPQPQPPVIASKPCDGCGGIGDSPKFLRWAKAARGEPVTISVNESGKPATLHWLTPEIILQEWYKPWEVDTCIRFKLIKRGKADIRIAYQRIDGPGGTRGFAWLPNQSVEHMESGGDLSGDMRIDSSDRWTTKEEVHETGEHEAGHTIGFPHTDKPEDVMYAYARRFRRPHSLNDKRAKTTRYPVKQEAIPA